MIPIPTPILRLTHIENLPTILSREGLHSSNKTPFDQFPYKPIHNPNIQQKRHIQIIPCGPKGTLHDYVPFYFGRLSPMLFQIHTKQIPCCPDGQEKVIYLVAHVQEIIENNMKYVFSDGHGIARFTKYFDNIVNLDKIDFQIVNQKQWADDESDRDRQRKKQAEFLIHDFCPWICVREIIVMNQNMRDVVLEIFSKFSSKLHRPISIKRNWYY